jgi:hypothetical protein
MRKLFSIVLSSLCRDHSSHTFLRAQGAQKYGGVKWYVTVKNNNLEKLYEFWIKKRIAEVSELERK